MTATSITLVAPAAADLTAWLTSRGFFVQVADWLLLERLLRHQGESYENVTLRRPLLEGVSYLLSSSPCPRH